MADPQHRSTPPDVNKGITLDTYVLEGMRGRPGATGVFTSLLNQLGTAIKLISSRVRSAGLADILGATGLTNVQGERVQKLDTYANDVLINVLERRGHCRAIASEEMDEPQLVSSDERARYIVLFDPLDGSSNIDVGVSIGTIFGILRLDRLVPGETLTEQLLRPGHELAAAGYAIYGSSTILVLSTGRGTGVHGFTFDPSVGEFFLSHEDIRCPPEGNTYSINEGNRALWAEPVQRWNDWIKEPREGDAVYGQRYVGSLVADAHRTLLKGGIFVYPADKKNPEGKLRLLYEANPMAFLFEEAGGAATDGTRRVLDIMPERVHQRVPMALGSSNDVRAFREFMQGTRR